VNTHAHDQEKDFAALASRTHTENPRQKKILFTKEKFISARLNPCSSPKQPCFWWKEPFNTAKEQNISAIEP